MSGIQGTSGKVLENGDLLALVLGGQATHWDLAGRILEQFGSLRGIAQAETNDLVGLSGVGPARAAQLKAAMALAERIAQERCGPRPRFLKSQDIFDYVHLSLRDLQHEVFEVLLLDTRNQLLRRVRVSTGTLNGSLVHPREVFRPAVADAAASLILVHNHPSGDPTPSREDIEVTDRIVAAGEMMGIRVLDHIVVGDGVYLSMADAGRLLTGAGKVAET